MKLLHRLLNQQETIARKKMSFRAFTLIELLVVVAIIGILAAVGVVAYNGYTASAKINATKTIHSQVVKYISAEILKCSIGESKFMGKNQDCPATAAKAVKGTVATITDKNPFDPTSNAIANSNGYYLGKVSVSDDGSKVLVLSCFKSGCGEHDRLKATIYVD